MLNKIHYKCRVLIICLIVQVSIPLFSNTLIVTTTNNIKEQLSQTTPNIEIAHPSIIAPGDILEINLVNNPELNTKQSVTPGGSISIPKLGRITVINLSLPQLDELLKKEFSKYYKKPEFSVFIIPRSIYIVQTNLETRTSVVIEAKNVDEANALMGTTTANMNAGDSYHVNVGKAPDFWHDDSIKLLTAIGLIVGIMIQMR
ncbi:MAG: hypothetical protein A2Y40_00295 [Candidatus Margulisbacteria bacterium GWF2_35_9]|nr:MAG: hypothetical protein A2Y40_00295 [Candidatus Margulisbacteria bacterium GWF2_35_9]